MSYEKTAVITELVAESTPVSNATIAEEMLAWFRDEFVPAPWVKEVKRVVVFS
ncbi:MAG: hypothetical protein N3E52_02365 [Candidatus Bathyarchaeota archaeon]|nr:hypothetical protein [Candidatus Bathyarchaeota archaeon]